MANLDGLEIKVTVLGIPELQHLIAMLQANTAVLPRVVVSAMQELAKVKLEEDPAS